MALAVTYRTALTADEVRPDGRSTYGDLRLERLTDAGISWHVLDRHVSPVPGEQLRGVHSVVAMAHAAFTEDTVAMASDLRHIARFGSGYDNIDIEACTRAGVVVTNTPDALRRPMALASLTLLLALAHQLLPKDRLVRTARWDLAGDHRGHGLDGRTVGIVGFGGIGSELAATLVALGVDVVGTNRSGTSRRADELGVALLSLPELLAVADYVVVCAPLTEQTQGLIGAEQLAAMKPTAYLVNVGRGKVVDTVALRQALLDGVIAGAGLDVFDPEPPDRVDPLLRMGNVVLSPHSLCWTDAFVDAVSTSVVGAIIDVAAGRRPQHVVNPEVLEAEPWRSRVRAAS
ncbi:2-hydroxyacid dehydrogenase [Jiangella endophytica]|uniref:2-hydroxyacid dehydrogenase n=1 Tax=Jiangella endophytica TaxID=1623398 RepID=UPI000E357D29|nr:NAD(P)-dependent oxidoreductase [Jiangella endophytica]